VTVDSNISKLIFDIPMLKKYYLKDLEVLIRKEYMDEIQL